MGSCRVVTASSVYPRGSHQRARFPPDGPGSLFSTKPKVGILKGWLLDLKNHFNFRKKVVKLFAKATNGLKA